MRKNFLWIMATAIIFTSSCAKAPEEVKKENDILNNTEKAESAELEYQTLDEIRKTSADTLATNTTNVTVNKLIIGNGDVMPAYKVLPYNNNFDLLKPLVKYLYNEEFSLDSPYCEYNIGGQKYNEDDPESDINPHSSIMYAGESMDFTRSLYTMKRDIPFTMPFQVMILIVSQNTFLRKSVIGSILENSLTAKVIQWSTEASGVLWTLRSLLKILWTNIFPLSKRICLLIR